VLDHPSLAVLVQSLFAAQVSAEPAPPAGSSPLSLEAAATPPSPGLTIDAEARFALPSNGDFPANWVLGLWGTFGYDLGWVRPALQAAGGTMGCKSGTACSDGEYTLGYLGGNLAIPVVQGKRVRLELEAGYGLGIGMVDGIWHGPEGGVFLGFPADFSSYSRLPRWWGVKLSAQQIFARRTDEESNSLLLGVSLVYRVQ